MRLRHLTPTLLPVRGGEGGGAHHHLVLRAVAEEHVVWEFSALMSEVLRWPAGMTEPPTFRNRFYLRSPRASLVSTFSLFAACDCDTHKRDERDFVCSATTAAAGA